MKISKSILTAILSFVAISAYAEEQTSVITPLENEKWWGAGTFFGSHMPYENFPEKNLHTSNYSNQSMPLFVSSKGRYIWNSKPFKFSVKNGSIIIKADEKIEPVVAGKTLKDAYLAASKIHFEPSGKIPEDVFFSMPQYNTWIELMYNQNQKDIEKYAENVIKHGFPIGVFMIDDNWQNYYGNFDFRADKFPDPKGMIARLHEKGFKVMFWICPFVSPAMQEFRDLNKLGYLIKDARNPKNPAIVEWWNGFSACYDLTNPKALEHFKNILKNMQEKYGVDGFKFDAGDKGSVSVNTLFHNNATPSDHCEAWAKLGLEFPYNEYRACWKNALQPLVQRLQDKKYSWGGIKQLIPDILAAGLIGHPYICPDMIGGGEYRSFLNPDMTPIDIKKIDQKLIVRSCQVHALMPMMQFSVAPWRILDKKHIEICAKFANLHKQFGPYILELAHHASRTGEPIVRHLEYQFPHQGFENCKDQFMLGDKYLVAPVITSDDAREVKLPAGQWKDDLGAVHIGPTTLQLKNVPIDRLPYYQKIN